MVSRQHRDEAVTQVLKLKVSRTAFDSISGGGWGTGIEGVNNVRHPILIRIDGFDPILLPKLREGIHNHPRVNISVPVPTSYIYD